MEPWRVSRPFGADSHNSDDEQDPDPYPHQSGKSDPDQPQSKNSFRILFSVQKRDPDPDQRDPYTLLKSLLDA
jgi:hypothetical protein